MVDALHEAWRVLSEHGILVDLRPLSSSACPIEVVTPDQVVEVGEVDASGTVADDVAADRAMALVLQDEFYQLRTETRFELEFSWHTVSEMAFFMESSTRMQHVSPPYADLEEVHRRLSAESRGRVRLRYHRTMMMAAYQKAASRRQLQRDVVREEQTPIQGPP